MWIKKNEHSLRELRKIVVTVLLALVAVSMLPACSTTKETPPPEETGVDSEPCDCLLGDIECKEKCLLDIPI